MQYKKHLPSEPLRKYISHYWTMNADLHEDILTSRDIPNGNIEVIINFGSTFKKIEADTQTREYKNGGIKGQFDHPVFIEQTGKVDILGISFKPWGFYPFLQCPLDEIANEATSLNLLINSELKECLFNAKRNGKWLDFLNLTLAAKIDLNTEIHPILLSSIQTITNCPTFRIDQLYKQYGLSPKSLQRLYKQKVGLSAKQFARIMRMQKLLTKLAILQEPDWMQLVVDFDFYDHSHLSKEFKTIIGTNPSGYFKNKDTFSTNNTKFD